MFEKLYEFESASLNSQRKQKISEHLQSPENKFKKYFSDLKEASEVFPRNPFFPVLNTKTIHEEVQDKLLDLRNNSAGREMCMIKSLIQF